MLIAAALVAVLGIAYFVVGDRGEDGANGAVSGFEAELAVAGPLGDFIEGSPDAPVTIIEYASMTCPHCADFHVRTYPRLKADYIDAGKVRLIYREFPFDPVATAASMLARCAGDERFKGFVEVLFRNQAKWAFAENPMAEIAAIARQGGFSKEQFEACMRNQDILDGLREAQRRAVEEFEVRSTPTFFINGQKVEGNRAYDEFARLIDEELPQN